RLDGQVRRRRVEPRLAFGGRHGNPHGRADLVGAENKVVLDLLLGQADVLQALVAHVLRAVAIEAVVDEVARAALQRLGVEPVDRRGVHANIRPRRERGPAHQKRKKSGDRFHRHRTLSGTGFVLSRRVYHGIRKKKRKYTIVRTRATTVALSAPPRIGQLSLNCPQTVTGTTPR